MRDKIFRHIHSSSRFDRSPESLEKALDNYMSKADLITLTEVSARPRSEKLKENGWAHVIGNHGGGDDAGIVWKKSEFEEVYSTTIQLSEVDGPGRTDIYAAVAVLEHKCGRTLLVLDVHMPAGIEMSGGFRKNTIKFITWQKSKVKLRLQANRLARRFKADAVMIVADWNLNLKMQWVQQYFKANFPRYTITWEKPYPNKGTHGRRLIDFTLIRKKLKVLVDARLLPKDSSSDHVAYLETLEFE